jgi:hypothetical protein
MSLFRAIDPQIKSSWTNSPSWVLNAPKTAQATVLATSGVPEKAIGQATVPIALALTKAPICEHPENKLTTPISKYITA